MTQRLTQPPPDFTPPKRFDFVRLKQVFKRRGRSRSYHYQDVKAKLFPAPIKIGPRAAANPDYEIDIMNRAEAAGMSEPDRRALVARLEAARTVADLEDLS